MPCTKFPGAPSPSGCSGSCPGATEAMDMAENIFPLCGATAALITAPMVFSKCPLGLMDKALDF